MAKSIEEMIKECERKIQLATVCFPFLLIFPIFSSLIFSFETFSIFLHCIFSYYLIKARHDQLLRNGQSVPPTLVSFIVEGWVMLMRYCEEAQIWAHNSIQTANRSLALPNGPSTKPISSLISNWICTLAPITSTSLSPSRKQCTKHSLHPIHGGI